jgi:hypothetical protein
VEMSEDWWDIVWFLVIFGMGFSGGLVCGR